MQKTLLVSTVAVSTPNKAYANFFIVIKSATDNY